MSLHGHIILIIEPEPLFALDLQASIERDRGESIACADMSAAVARCAKFKFTAAIVNTLRRTYRSPQTVDAGGDLSPAGRT